MKTHTPPIAIYQISLYLSLSLSLLPLLPLPSIHPSIQPTTSYSHLTHANVHEGLGGRMFDLEQTHDRRTVVAYRDPPAVGYELVHASGTEGRPDGIGHGLAGVDVAYQLRLALFFCFLFGSSAGGGGRTRCGEGGGKRRRISVVVSIRGFKRGERGAMMMICER